MGADTFLPLHMSAAGILAPPPPPPAKKAKRAAAAAAAAAAPPLNAASLNAHVVRMQYAVRGEVLDVATALRKRLDAGADHGLPFDEVVSCNIGNPQALGQSPPPFARQVLSLCINPDLAGVCPAGTFLPQAVDRAARYLSRTKGCGAYSGSQGVQVVREEVAEFIARRDGFPADPDNIFLTNGASDGVKALMQTVIRGGAQRDGVLVPIPQYPLYSALAALYDGELVGYYLDESADWGMTVAELTRAADAAAARGICVRGLVVINPGNPTSQQLALEDMRHVVRFCAARGLVLMADEVYQANLYGERAGTFTSFKKVVSQMIAHGGGEQQAGDDATAAAAVSLVSFHSISKGFTGECGIRGGYFELHSFAPDVKAMLYKLASISLCSNLPGQFAVGLMCNPPRTGAAHEMCETHRRTIMSSLERRAAKMTATLAEMEGVTCGPLKASMYGFPKLRLPAAALQAAADAGKEADLFYCLELLRATGIVTVPGSGFKQRDGEYHFRITILPAEDKLDGVLARLKTFHKQFMDRYRGGDAAGPM